MLRVGIVPIDPILHAKNGHLLGVLGEIMLKYYKFPANITTWIAMDHLENSLDYFTIDTIDVPSSVALLPELNDNITSGPPLAREACYLMSSRGKKVREVSSKFTSIFEHITSGALIAITAINLLLLLMLIMIMKRGNMDKMLMNFIGLFFRQKSAILSKFSANIVFTCCAVFFFFTQLIALSFLQTDMLLVDNEIKIENFNDVKKHQQELWGSASGGCASTYNSIKSPQDVNLKTFSDPSVLQNTQDLGVIRSNCVILTEVTNFQRQFVCSYLKTKIDRVQNAWAIYYFSKQPALSYIRSMFYRKSLDAKSAQLLHFYIYGQFEAGNLPNPEKISSLAYVQMFGKKEDPACTENDRSQNDQLNALSMTYFNDLIYVYVLIVTCACIVLACEYLFA